jgi:small multidrug resistance family-3 protein
MLTLLKPLAFFTLAGLCEIGDGYLMWQWLKSDRPGWMGAAGALLLMLYGWVATWQPTSFGNTYAVYGGIFMVMSIAWAWHFDGFRPDRFDISGGVIYSVGIGIILFWPHS